MCGVTMIHGTTILKKLLHYILDNKIFLKILLFLMLVPLEIHIKLIVKKCIM